MLVIFMLLLSSADVSSKLTVQKFLPGILSVSNGLDPDQDRRFVGPDLGPKCLQWLSKVPTNKERVKTKFISEGIFLITLILKKKLADSKKACKIIQLNLNLMSCSNIFKTDVRQLK